MPKKIHLTLTFTVVIAILILTMGCATNRVVPGKQCINLFERGSEIISAEVVRDSDGCIREESVIFYKNLDCSGEGEIPEFRPRKPGFLYASSTRGGCPQLVTVSTRSPACITLTLKSGRQTEICW